MNLRRKPAETSEREPKAIDERDSRIAQLERRLEQLHPSTPAAVARPYGIGDEVFGVRDEEGTVALTVISYPAQEGFVCVAMDGDPEPRTYPLAGLRSHEKCPERSQLAFMKQDSSGALKRVELAPPELSFTEI